jgi:peptidyl-prolyl isomerase E (cyclophilin E)
MDDVALQKRTVVYVGGVATECDDATLQAAFIPFGEIVQVMMPRDEAGVDGKHRGFGFVEFEHADDAKEAVDNMHESELFGRVLKVNIARADAMRKQAVWHEADKWAQNSLAADSKAVDSEIRHTVATN